MLFNSLEFIFLFLPLTILIVGYFAKRHDKVGFYLSLSVCSLLFYSYWNWRYLFIILISIAVNFNIGKLLNGKKARSFYWLGITFNLGLLVLFKYLDFVLIAAGDMLNSNI